MSSLIDTFEFTGTEHYTGNYWSPSVEVCRRVITGAISENEKHNFYTPLGELANTDHVNRSVTYVSELYGIGTGTKVSVGPKWQSHSYASGFTDRTIFQIYVIEAPGIKHTTTDMISDNEFSHLPSLTEDVDFIPFSVLAACSRPGHMTQVDPRLMGRNELLEAAVEEVRDAYVADENYDLNPYRLRYRFNAYLIAHGSVVEESE